MKKTITLTNGTLKAKTIKMMWQKKWLKGKDKELFMEEAESIIIKELL